MSPIGGKNGPPIKRDWNQAYVEKVEDQVCRVCGRGDRKIEAAHIAGREHDLAPAIGYEEVPLVRSKLFVAPSRIVPLCGPCTDSESCHGKEHCGEGLELLPHLTTEEQVQAVADIGSIDLAARKLNGGGRAPSLLEVRRLAEEVGEEAA